MIARPLVAPILMLLLAAACSSPASAPTQPASPLAPTSGPATAVPPQTSTPAPQSTATPVPSSTVAATPTTRPQPSPTARATAIPTTRTAASPTAARPTAAATVAPSPVAAASTLAHFESADNGFGFDYPAHWRLAKQASNSATAGSDPIESVGVGLANGPTVMVSVYQLSMDVADASQTELKAELDRVLAQLAREVDAKILLNQPYKLGNLSGFEYRLQYNESGKTMQSRQVHFFVGDRQYSVVMEVDPAGQAAEATNFERLLASFEAPVRGPNGERLARAVAAAGHAADYAAIKPGPYFAKGTRAFEVIFEIEGAKAGKTLVGTWIADRVAAAGQPGEKILEKSVRTEAGDFQGYFSLTYGGDFPAGDYALELRLDGKLLRRVKIHVAG